MVEPTIHDQLNIVVGSKESTSSYIRKLIIKDLKDRNLLTTDDLERILIGDET